MTIDPELVGLKAFSHPAVREWWCWLLEEYRPRYPVALVTPCSRVKPYTRSPTSRKVRGLLRRLRLWDSAAGRPRGIEWLFFSDLLLLVPYERAEEYPACCYDVAPDMVLASHATSLMVAERLAEAMERLAGRGLRELIVYLPKKHMVLWQNARMLASRWPRETLVRFTIFDVDGLARALQPYRRVAELQELLQR